MTAAKEGEQRANRVKFYVDQEGPFIGEALKNIAFLKGIPFDPAADLLDAQEMGINMNDCKVP